MDISTNLILGAGGCMYTRQTMMQNCRLGKRISKGTVPHVGVVLVY